MREKKLDSAEFPDLLMADNPQYSPLPMEPALPKTSIPVCSIALGCDNHYVPHLGALLCSIFENASPGYFLEIFILENSITETQKNLISSLKDVRNNTALHFLNMDRFCDQIETHSYFTPATFHRLYLPNILKSRDKVLYLDTDMIVLNDVYDLFSIDISSYYAAAASDLIMQTLISMELCSHSGSGALPAKEYLSKYLDLSGLTSQYFQAGTLLLNLKKMRENNLSEKMIHDLSSKSYWFLDQDILNKYMRNEVLPISNQWNAVNIFKNNLKYLPKTSMDAYTKSRQNPYIIHYADHKPWKSNINDHFPYYWKYLRKTPWYESVLKDYIAPLAESRMRILPKIRAFAISSTKKILYTLFRKNNQKIFSFIKRCCNKIGLK